MSETLPESLAQVPNIPHEQQTPAQLRAERDYWREKEKGASGPAGAIFASGQRRACELWIAVRKREATRNVG